MEDAVEISYVPGLTCSAPGSSEVLMVLNVANQRACPLSYCHVKSLIGAAT